MKRVSRRRAARVERASEETEHLEQISRRYEEAERAWQRMTAPIEDDETWARVEEHLLERPGPEQERRWKFFSK